MNILLSMNYNMYDIPVLFLVFNQPHITQKTFDQIKRIKPTKLFISADGPRNEKEKTECNKVKEIFLKQINWDCQLEINYFKKNNGVKKAVSKGISWFFSKVELGVILEYDCLPNKSFFDFMRENLYRYKDSKDIFCISGSNHQKGITRGQYSYYYSSIPSVWGWGTWKKKWLYWNGNIDYIKKDELQNILKKKFPNRKAFNFWLNKYNEIKSGNDSTWGHPWCFSLFYNNGIAIIPNKNLIKNIGFSERATHARNLNDIYANQRTYEIKNINHPIKIEIDYIADIFYTNNLDQTSMFIKLYEMIKTFIYKPLPYKIKKYLKKIKNKII